MKKLIEGIRGFQTNYVPRHRDLLENLSHGQHPRVLFITCSDSRISPSLLTQTDLGDLFVIRNAGNIIPPYGAANGGEGGTIEYALHALGIDQIVVCGHSHCGAMKGLLQLGKLEAEMPLVYDWLRHAEATRRLVRENYVDFEEEELLEITIAENVLTQIENLKTYPIVRSRLHQGKLRMYAWIYLIETGEVLAYDPETRAYTHPQSQLIEDRDAADQRYSKTNAPPVTCELPPIVPESVVFTGNGNKTTISTSTPVVPAASTAAPAAVPRSGQSWLSPEQADRIYRGSKAR
ncbi:carbonic anhydrase [Phormidium tenue FACHB-886]|nr:carbonic anhydrase [Phormidium tenue FACHB-886]